MKQKIILFLVALFAFVALSSAFGQKAKKEVDVFKLPDDYCLTVAMIQKDSPVQFEGIDVLVDEKGTAPFLNWTLRNNSSKTVRRFVVAFKIRTNVEEWQGVGRGATSADIGTNEANDLILPYSSYTDSTYSNWGVGPAGVKKLFARKNEWDDRKYIMVYGMITKVVFSDGSVYRADNEIFQEF